MRLTAELIHKSSQYLNAIDDYHLNLRGIFYSKFAFRMQNNTFIKYELY